MPTTPAPRPDTAAPRPGAVSESYVTDDRTHYQLQIFDDPVVEGTDLQQQEFKAKMEAFRKGGMPSYIGPRAGRDE